MTRFGPSLPKRDSPIDVDEAYDGALCAELPHLKHLFQKAEDLLNRRKFFDDLVRVGLFRKILHTSNPANRSVERKNSNFRVFKGNLGISTRKIFFFGVEASASRIISQCSMVPTLMRRSRRIGLSMDSSVSKLLVELDLSLSLRGRRTRSIASFAEN